MASPSALWAQCSLRWLPLGERGNSRKGPSVASPLGKKPVGLAEGKRSPFGPPENRSASERSALLRPSGARGAHRLGLLPQRRSGGRLAAYGAEGRALGGSASPIGPQAQAASLPPEGGKRPLLPFGEQARQRACHEGAQGGPCTYWLNPPGGRPIAQF